MQLVAREWCKIRKYDGINMNSEKIMDRYLNKEVTKVQLGDAASNPIHVE